MAPFMAALWKSHAILRTPGYLQLASLTLQNEVNFSWKDFSLRRVSLKNIKIFVRLVTNAAWHTYHTNDKKKDFHF